MKKLTQFLTDHALVLVISAISIVSLILILIVFTLASSGSSGRKITVKDISGSAFILKNDGQIPANKNMELESGDVIITSSDGELKLSVDKDKYIYIEPDTTLYVNFTDTAEKGSIIVNISEGSAICRLDSKLRGNSAFEVRTPNAVISAAGTVFRTDFTYYESYGGHNAVKLTEAECAEGSVNIQLYDDFASPADQLMLLAEGKSARLMTCPDVTRFEYLNCDTDLYSLGIPSLKAYLRISSERQIAYSLSSLNTAYQNAMGLSGSEIAPEQAIMPSETAPPILETEPVSETASLPSETTSRPNSETAASTSADTSETTTGTTPISVAETTTRVYNVTTAPSQTTSVPAVTSPPLTTEQQTSSIPVIKPAAPVTSTVAPQTEPPVTTASDIPETTVSHETTVPVSTIPWWEIINSAALSS